MHHPVTSSTAAQAMAIVPRRVCIRSRSLRMRASTGNAVMLMAAPMNRAKLVNDTLSPEIIVEQEFEEMLLLEATLAARSAHKVRITSSVRGIRARWVD